MDITTLLALAVALAVDAFTVAVAAGIQLRRVTAAQTLRMAGTFGFFQFAMPLAGWGFGVGIQAYIEAYAHWIAFALLVFVGAGMLRDAWDARGRDARAADAALLPDTSKPSPPDPTGGRQLLILAVATSIDALAVGLSMAVLGQAVFFPAVVIGVVCFTLTACGIRLGGMMRAFAGKWGSLANVFGAFVLIAIAFSILRDHGVFA